jgi:hypothetical protein
MTDPALKEIRDHVQRIDDALRGNGSAGLFTEFAVLRERVSAIEKFIIEIQGLRRWVLLGILGLFGTLGWNVVEWYLNNQ